MNFLLMHVYGENHLRHRLLLSALSFVARRQKSDEHFMIVIYTDQPRHMRMFFGDFVKVEEMESDFFDQFGKGNDAAQKIKMHVIKDFLNNHYGNMLYADIDTYFYRSSQPEFDKINGGSFLINRPINDEQYYDTGIIGIQTEKAAIMDDVIRKYHEMPADLAVREREQRAFAEVFSSGKLEQPDEELIYHYKDRHEKLQPYIDQFFSTHYYRELGELMQLAAKWDPQNWESKGSDIELI